MGWEPLLDHFTHNGFRFSVSLRDGVEPLLIFTLECQRSPEISPNDISGRLGKFMREDDEFVNVCACHKSILRGLLALDNPPRLTW